MDFLGIWNEFLALMDRVVAWLLCVVGKQDWDPDFGR